METDEAEEDAEVALSELASAIDGIAKVKESKPAKKKKPRKYEELSLDLKDGGIISLIKLLKKALQNSSRDRRARGAPVVRDRRAILPFLSTTIDLRRTMESSFFLVRKRN